MSLIAGSDAQSNSIKKPRFISIVGMLYVVNSHITVDNWSQRIWFFCTFCVQKVV